MPHFFSIALFHFDDYKAAEIPVLPIKKGIVRTKIHMVIYIVSFIVAAAMLTFFNYTGYLYLIVAVSFGLAWLGLSIRGFSSQDNQLWGGQMIRLSLLLITAICFAISFDVQTSVA
jgi:protoheme IX farnesyltransferase